MSRKKYEPLHLSPAESYPNKGVHGKIEPIFQFVFENGKKVLRKVGEKDRHEEIQKAAVGITPAEIVARGMSPAESPYKPYPEQFGDATNMNADIIDAKVASDRAKSAWEALPEGFRAQFGNSPENFLKNFSDSYIKAYIDSQSPSVEPPASEGKE